MKPDKTQIPKEKEMKEPVAVAVESNPADLLLRLKSLLKQNGIRVVVVDFSGQLESAGKNQSLNTLIEAYPIPLVLAASGVLKGWSSDVLLRSHICHAAASLLIHFENIEEARMFVGRDVRNNVIPEIVTANAALELGLINSITGRPGAFIDALSTAKRISQMAPLAVKACLKAVSAGKSTEDKGLDEELRLFSELFDSNDTKRGTNAFLNKTFPTFEGN